MSLKDRKGPSDGGWTSVVYLLVPAEGLHLREELRVVLRGWDGAALRRALQTHFL